MIFAKKFKIVEDKNEHFILFDDFYDVLKEENVQLRQSNLRRTICTYYKDQLEKINDKDYIRVFSVLKYCFQHSDSTKVCKSIATQVTCDICKDNSDNLISIRSSLELYKLITKTSFHDKSALFDSIQIAEEKIETLICEHKVHFTEREWKKICWFENHFSKFLNQEYTYHDIDYENIIELKYSKFQSILTFQECHDSINKLLPLNIKEKKGRLHNAEIQNKVSIFSKARHSPYIIDDQLKCIIEADTDIFDCDVVSFDTLNSVNNNSICILVGFKQAEELCYNEICERLVYDFRKKHDCDIETVHFVYQNNLQSYVNDEDGSIARFQLRDDIENKIFSSFEYQWHSKSLESSFLCDSDMSECLTCNHGSTIEPLAVNTFSLSNEWFLETPIEIQIILESFLNKRSFRKNREDSNYQLQKYQKLYQTHDVLQNIFNQKYIGLFQRKTTQELLIEYKSISSVFDITSKSGTTSSLKFAENKLKKNANSDMCYYNTYLKKHEIEYTNINGECVSSTSLRDCHVILMLDNLVRLQYVSDPNPGENRSKQICTLPITLQGLPIDSEATMSWHLPECDGSETCECKQPDKLDKNDIQRVLLENNVNEQKMLTQFQRLMTWSNVRIWSHLTDNLLEYVSTGVDEYFAQNITAKNAGLTFAEDTMGTNQSCRLEMESGQLGSDTCQVEINSSCQLEEELEETEDDIDLGNMLDYLDMIEDDSFDTDIDGEVCDGAIEDMSGCNEITDLEVSIGAMSISEDVCDENHRSVQELLSSFGFSKFIVPKLLCRHPPPATGRDDDITKIREILDDILVKMGYTTDDKKMVNRILCGPDHKIGQCLLKLMDMYPKYRCLLPEFPLLHLRKSKINILFSAYKEAGIVQLIQFMKDDNQDDLTKLISIQNIDNATRYVKRLALALHLAFMISFTQTLGTDELESFIRDMETNTAKEAADNWSAKFEEYIKQGSEMNATFSLHRDMMNHCDSVVAVALSERLGGQDGYALLLAAVKSSILFSFVNNASSYAPYCVKLLYYHYQSGHFHRHLKQTLYTTPFKGSNRNFATDTKREMDHIDVLKGFRSGSNVSSITCRMSLIDSLNETREPKERSPVVDDDALGWDLTDVDIKHILPTTELVIRRKGLSTTENNIPYNVYTKTPTVLPSSILDECSENVGKYLLYRYVCKNRLFEMTESDIPLAESIKGPQELVSIARRSTGITLKRTLKSKIHSVQTEKELKEEKRKKTVAKETKRIDCMSSDNNACQALVKPDSSKPKVIKSIGMQRALKTLIITCLSTTSDADIQPYMNINTSVIPATVTASMKLCTVEFAGFKFKMGNIKSGKEYIQQVENMIKSIVLRNSSKPTVVICEEKYMFTPDDLKAGTRKQRKTDKTSTMSHLKVGNSILNDNIYNKDAIISSIHGKEIASTYLAEKVETLTFNQDFTLIVDSQLHVTEQEEGKQSHPLKCEFLRNERRTRIMSEISQRKGEAEMAVIDWMIELGVQLKEGEGVVCLVTSGDIDAVCAHIYVVSKFWPRDLNGKFKISVHVILQKPRSKFDIYDVTAIVELLESYYNDQTMGMKVAIGLCMGGNDFIPKFHLISHSTILQHVVRTEHLFDIDHQSKVLLHIETYIELIKTLYCPKKHDPSNVTFENVRGVTIGKQGDKSVITDPRKWLPPRSAVEKMAALIQLQIEYLESAGKHSAKLPDFLSKGCLNKNESGEVEFNFGPDAHFQSSDDLPDVPIFVRKRSHKNTPQKGNRRKRQLTSTPKKVTFKKHSN